MVQIAMNSKENQQGQETTISKLPLPVNESVDLKVTVPTHAQLEQLAHLEDLREALLAQENLPREPVSQVSLKIIEEISSKQAEDMLIPGGNQTNPIVIGKGGHQARHQSKCWGLC